MKFNRQFNKAYKGSKGVGNNLPSMTIPDMNLTLKELLHNHTRGIQSEVHNYEAEYFGDDEIPIVSDLTDLDTIKRQNAERRTELEKELKQIEADRKRKTQAAITKIPAPDIEANKGGKTHVPDPIPDPQKTVPKTQPENG